MDNHTKDDNERIFNVELTLRYPAFLYLSYQLDRRTGLSNQPQHHRLSRLGRATIAGVLSFSLSLLAWKHSRRRTNLQIHTTSHQRMDGNMHDSLAFSSSVEPASRLLFSSSFPTPELDTFFSLYLGNV